MNFVRGYPAPHYYAGANLCGSRAQSRTHLGSAEMEQRRRSQRRLKLTGDNNLLDVNADFMATYTLLNEPTLYPSAYMVLTNKGYTNVAKAESRASSLALPRRSSVTVRKHYYAGTERVAARLGGGDLDAIGHTVGSNDTLMAKADLLFNQSLDQVNNRVLQENDPDCIMNSTFAREEFGHWIEDIPLRMQAIGAVNLSPFWDMANSMLGDHNNGRERDVYFYHSDHLGSASWKKETSDECFASERGEEPRSGMPSLLFLLMLPTPSSSTKKENLLPKIKQRKCTDSQKIIGAFCIYGLLLGEKAPFGWKIRFSGCHVV